MVLHLTWGQVGTGCQMFSIDSLLTLVRRQLIIMRVKLSPAYRVYFGVDEFITIADNLAEIEATLNPLKKEAALSCTNLLLRQKQPLL
jgi:hypothetical protein